MVKISPIAIIASSGDIAYCDISAILVVEMAQDTPSRKLDQYIVRFPDGMRDDLKKLAERNGRSLNAEIIHRLAESMEPYDRKEFRLEQQIWTLEADLKKYLSLLMQLSPEERRILEERDEIFTRAKEHGFTSKGIKRFTKVYRVGGRGRQYLNMSTPNYDVLLSKIDPETQEYIDKKNWGDPE